jgi:peptidoglycan/LPS O-acetylase OafA/YrhL
MENKKKSFLNYINVFRGLAILLIIAGHTMQFGESSTLIHKINCELICGGTTLFIFISGFLFQHLSSKFEYKTYLKKKWTNVVLPYFLTSLVGIAFCFIYPQTYGNSFDGLNPLLQIPMFLTTGRIHNTPAWFIPMIVIFFLCSWLLLKLEKKGILYKALPFLFLITIFLPRISPEYSNLIGISYPDRYFAYVNYVLMGFVHFLSLYIFGMFCSANKGIIDKFYDKRFLLWSGMLITSGLNIYLTYKFNWCNYTISKTFLTMLLLGYLKHYDEFILSHNKTNKTLDFIAKYSFGLFFIHWYWFFIYNQIFHISGVITSGSIIHVISCVVIRFVAVAVVSTLNLFAIKYLLLKINKDTNTRMFIGV